MPIKNIEYTTICLKKSTYEKFSILKKIYYIKHNKFLSNEKLINFLVEKKFNELKKLVSE